MRILYNTQGKSDETITIEKSDSLTDGSFIFSNTQSQNLNIIDLRSLESGVGMFQNSNLSSSTLEDIARTIKTHTDGGTHIINLGNNVDDNVVATVTGKGWNVKSVKTQGGEKYSGCLTVDDVKLVDANYKTTDVVNGVWIENLDDLTDGYHMFHDSYNLITFATDLPNLTEAISMFEGCVNLTSFDVDLPSLTDGRYMFIQNYNLKSFSSDLSSLTNGDGMFYRCLALTSFNSELPSLESGDWMFYACSLGVDSIVRIANSLPLQWKSEIHIGNLGESINPRIVEACELMGMKGWTVKYGKDDVYNQQYITSNKYDGCKTTDEVTNVNPNLESDVQNGFWIHPFKDLTDGGSLFYANRSINNFCADLSSLKYGGRMFYSMNGSEVESLINFCSSMPNLIDGESMFGCDTMLKSFKGGLKYLTNGFEMFYDCTALSVFNEKLTSLTNGAAMFRNCTSLSELNFNLQNMVDGSNMFNVNRASHTSFKGKLTSLIQGHSMFKNRLRSFDGDLSSLEIGKDMFRGCCLDKKSIKNIASSIKQLPVNPSWTYPTEYYTAQNYTGDQSWWPGSWNDSNRGIITLGIDSRLEADSEIQDYLKQIRAKNWTVEEEYNEIGSDNKIKYINCTKPLDVSTVEPNYKTVDVINGIWSEPLPKLRDGNSEENQKGMFQENADLVSFNTDLSSLTNGQKMFYSCSNLTSFNGDLSSLKDGSQMFDNCSKLTSFASDLCSLKDGKRMFYVCTALTSFTSELHNLNNGSYMFNACSNLTTFTSDLPSLTDNSWGMFQGCSSLTSFSSDLSSLDDGYYMFYNCTALTSFSSDLPSLRIGTWMFQGCSALTSFTSNLSSLEDGLYMFQDCDKLNSFNSDLPSLTNGRYMFYSSGLESFSSNLSSLKNGLRMFYGCSALTSFTSNLSSLTNGYDMFRKCSSLTSFNSNLSSLDDGYYMFDGCSALTSFSSDLPSLTHGYEMFYNCTALTSFSSDLPSLTNGYQMFCNCSNLTSFTSNLSNLTNGDSMFSDCELNAESIQHIADTINDLKSQGETGKIHIGYADDVPSIILYESGEILTNKGWTVYFKGVKWEQLEYGPYDVVKKLGYIPDASSWNDEIYIPNNLIITEITVKGEMINNE